MTIIWVVHKLTLMQKEQFFLTGTDCDNTNHVHRWERLVVSETHFENILTSSPLELVYIDFC